MNIWDDLEQAIAVTGERLETWNRLRIAVTGFWVPAWHIRPGWIFLYEDAVYLITDLDSFYTRDGDLACNFTTVDSWGRERHVQILGREVLWAA